MIHILMETVDLGGYPVKAFKYEGDATQACTLANTTYNSQKIADLMAHCGYTLEQAWDFVSASQQFYIDSVEYLE